MLLLINWLVEYFGVRWCRKAHDRSAEMLEVVIFEPRKRMQEEEPDIGNETKRELMQFLHVVFLNK